MAITVTMQSTQGLKSSSAIGFSGTSYTIDANGVMTGVLAGDINPFLNAGFVVLATNGRNNLIATTDPTAANDVSQDYAPGSTWNNTTRRRSWMNIANATGAAVWAPLTKGLSQIMRATGATQGGALLLTDLVGIITTCTASARGVRLPAPFTGDERTLYANTTQGVKVYPGTGARIGSSATNAAKVLAGFKAAVYRGLNKTTWVYSPSA